MALLFTILRLHRGCFVKHWRTDHQHITSKYAPYVLDVEFILVIEVGANDKQIFAEQRYKVNWGRVT